MSKILFIVGSFREQSFNMQLARKAASYITGAETSFLDYKDVPFVNQDYDYPVLEPVARVRNEVAAADALWIVTPEYNHSYSGVVKNLIDWLSRPVDPLDRKTTSVLKGKKVTISGAAGQDAAIDARQNTVRLAEAVGMEVIGGDGVGVILDKEAFVSNELKLSPEKEAELAAQAELLLSACTEQSV